MVGRTNVGGGGGNIVTTAWAYIGVIYPDGSVCTATNGTLTLTADGTSGLYVFQIPEPDSTPESWTVSCTNGTKNRSATVSISTQYQFANVTLRYSRLPEGYQEVEYLESSGTQYVDVGLIQNVYNYELSLDFEILAYQYSYAACGGNVSASVSIYIGRMSANTSDATLRYNCPSNIVGNVKINERANVVVNNNSNQVVENSVVIGSTNLSQGQYTRLYLFGSYTGTAYPNLVNAKIYSFAMRDKANDTYTHNFVPCYKTSNNEAGFYDLASNTFVANDGTGTFIVGADV